MSEVNSRMLVKTTKRSMSCEQNELASTTGLHGCRLVSSGVAWCYNVTVFSCRSCISAFSAVSDLMMPSGTYSRVDLGHAIMHLVHRF